MTVQFSSQAMAVLSPPPSQVWQMITLDTYKGRHTADCRALQNVQRNGPRTGAF
jgi:hypothetical protein